MGQNGGAASDPRGWYLLGVVLSVLAMLSVLFAQFNPKAGYPLGFAFTMFGLISISQPSWLSDPSHRVRLFVMNAVVLVTQAAIMYVSLYIASA